MSEIKAAAECLVFLTLSAMVLAKKERLGLLILMIQQLKN